MGSPSLQSLGRVRVLRNLPIKHKLTLVILAPCAFALVMLSTAYIVYQSVTLKQWIARDVMALTDLIAAQSAAAVAFGDTDAARELLASLKTKPEVVGALIYTEDGSIFARYTRGTESLWLPPAPQADGIRFDHDDFYVQNTIVQSGEKLGSVYLRASLHGLRRLLNVYFGVAALFLVISLALAYGLASRLQRVISRPILNLAATARSVSADRDYAIRAVRSSRDEIGVLVDSFNEMLEEIQSQDLARREANEEVRRVNDALEHRVRERTATLEATNKELEAFSYSVSHDLRAPLRHISGFVQLLNERAHLVEDEQCRRYLKVIGEGADRMGRLIDDLLNFSRAGRTQMNKQWVSVRELVHDVIGDLAADAEKRDVEWKIGTLPDVYGDRAMLKLVLVNLASNALKFTSMRSQACIEIGSVSSDQGEIICFVRDNGVGFDMKYVDRLFGVFQRLHRNEEFPGTGIGLANVQRIVNRHGGRTWAEGQIDVGATFYFTLPQAGQTEEERNEKIAAYTSR